MWVRSSGQGDPLEEKMAIHSSILVWKIPWTEVHGGLQSIELPRTRHNLAIEHTHRVFLQPEGRLRTLGSGGSCTRKVP